MIGSQAAGSAGETADFHQGVSVIIPHYGMGRLPQLAATLANMRQCDDVAEIIVVELGQMPVAHQLAWQWADKYVFARHSDAFQRARALNIATPLAIYDLLLWHDNDLLVPASYVQKACAELRERQLDFLIPYTSVHYLSPADSDLVRSGVRDPLECRPIKVLRSGTECVGGSGLVRNVFVRQYGGMHEGFRGWGVEDNAWGLKVRLIGQGAATQQQDQQIYHLFHQLSGGYDNAAPAARNPHYQANLALLQEMRDTVGRERFLDRFPAPAFFSCPWAADQLIVCVNDEAGADSGAVSGRVAGVLHHWYGCLIEHRALRRGDALPEQQSWEMYGAIIVFGAAQAQRFLSDPFYAHLWARVLAVIDGLAGLSSEDIIQLGHCAAILATDESVAAALDEAGVRHWRCDPASAGVGSEQQVAISLAQPLSLIAGGAAEAARQPDTSPSPMDTLPIWMYWEGECPAWIKQCQRTIFEHGVDVRLLTLQSFDELRDADRDIDLSRLHVAHRADFIRAFLLMRYGGLWIDSDCIVMQSLEPVLALLSRYDFVCHRERQGFFSNGFIGAATGSTIAAALYGHICKVLRSGQPIHWSTIGGTALTQILASARSDIWHELECEQIQPICWSNPAAFFKIAARRQHEGNLNRRAICYMLSNQQIQRFTAAKTARPTPALLDENTFFSFLLERAHSRKDPIAQDGTPDRTEPRSNEWKNIPFCIETLVDLAPQRVLELGPGYGRWGLLMREFLEASDSREGAGGEPIYLECVALAPQGIGDLHRSLYNKARIASDTQPIFDGAERWDVVIFGEATKQSAQPQLNQLLRSALRSADYVLVNASLDAPVRVSRQHENSGVSLGSSWRLDDFLGPNLARYTVASENGTCRSGAFLLSLDDPKQMRRRAQALPVWLEQEQLRAGRESRSGPGSSLAQTAEIRRRLPLLFTDLMARSVLDLPCGDFNWMRHVRLQTMDYIGADIMPHLIEQNQRRFGTPRRRFHQLDLLVDPLPRMDIVLCRDCLVHFSFVDITTALQNMKRSGAQYLLTTTFPRHTTNTDITSGDWRTLNLEQPPFNFPPPLRLIVEKCTEAGGQYSDKSLACWRLSDLLS